VSGAAPAPGWVVGPLAEHHDRHDFTCGVPALDDYLRRQAAQDVRKGAACVYVLTAAEDARTVLGFYSLSATVIPLRELPEAVSRRLPRYPNVPATLLGRLAVSSRHHGLGLGEHLLLEALALSLDQSRRVASAAVVVDAQNDAARAFYLHYGFIPLPGTPSRLFLPMKTIARLAQRRPARLR